MDLFDFIADPKFRSLLERDFDELERCVEAKASKSVLLLSGSIIEALLMEFFFHNPPSSKTKTQVLKMNLHDLIDEASNMGLIKPVSKDLSTVVRNYRNLIHPGLEVRKKEKFDHDTAVVAYHLVKIIISEVRETYLQKYGYKGIDIFNKILSDSSTFIIFDKLLNKLNNFETQLLFSHLIDYELKRFSFEYASQLQRYIDALKPIVGQDILIEYCNKLLTEVEKGEVFKGFALFGIFGTNIDLLKVEEQEIILTYIYDFINKKIIYRGTFLSSQRFRFIVSILSHYTDVASLKKSFFALILQIVKLYNSDTQNRWNIGQMYKELVSNFPSEKQEKIETYINEQLPGEAALFFSEMKEGFMDDLPF